MTSRNPARLLSAVAIAAVMTGGALAPLASAQPSSPSAAATCTTTKLAGAKPIKTRAGTKIGTARMFSATDGENLGFCVRISPIKSLRKVTTQALLPHKTYFPDGDRSSTGLIGGSGAWRHPFVVSGSDFGTGYSMRATAKIVVPGGPSGKVKIEGTLP